MAPQSKTTPAAALAAVLAAIRDGRMKSKNKAETFQNYVEAILRDGGPSLRSILRDRGTLKFHREFPDVGRAGPQEPDFWKVVVDPDQET